jgi:HEAT repeats
MMTRRKLRWMVVFSIAVLAVLLVPAARMSLIAVLRGEAFYRGSPSSVWSKTIREGAVPYSPPGYIVALDFHTHVPATTSDRVKKFLGLRYTVTAHRYPLRDDDPAAIPVLLDLLEDEHSLVRMYAAETLGALGPRAKVAVPALQKRLNDKEFGAFAISVEERAREAIARIESDGKE